MKYIVGDNGSFYWLESLPIVIGRGIRLFEDLEIELTNIFTLQKYETFKSEFMQINYAKN